MVDSRGQPACSRICGARDGKKLRTLPMNPGTKSCASNKTRLGSVVLQKAQGIISLVEAFSEGPMMSINRRTVKETGKRIARGHESLSGLGTWLMGMALVGLFIMAAAPAALADTVFSVTGNFGNGAAFETGSTITIDPILGIMTDSNLSISAGSNPSPATTFTGANIIQNGSFMTPFVWILGDGTELDFFRPFPDFQSLTGGPISLVTYFQVPGWGFSGGSSDTVLTPVHTPEPSAISLLGTGLLGLIGLALWRKRVRGVGGWLGQYSILS